MKILFAEDAFWDKNEAFKMSFERTVNSAYNEAVKVLSAIPEDLTFVAQANGYETIPETGEGGFTRNSRLVILTVDPELPYGVDKVLNNIRATVFHEGNHAARYHAGIWHHDFVDGCIMEGLATAFERDYANAKPLWGEYQPEETEAWLQEVIDKKVNMHDGEYMFKHSDGRRWIGYKVGIYIIDKAMKKSGKSVVELTTMECKAIEELAGLK